MKLKNDNILNKIGQVVSLDKMLEKDIITFHPLSEENLLDIDTSIHKIRKSLKSISAILYLFEFQLEPSQFLSVKFNLKSLSKHYAALREHFINLQIYYKLEGELKAIDESGLVELRTQFESKYNLIIQEKVKP